MGCRHTIANLIYLQEGRPHLRFAQAVIIARSHRKIAAKFPRWEHIDSAIFHAYVLYVRRQVELNVCAVHTVWRPLLPDKLITFQQLLQLHSNSADSKRSFSLRNVIFIGNFGPHLLSSSLWFHLASNWCSKGRNKSIVVPS